MPYFACTACRSVELLPSPPEAGEALLCPHCESPTVLVLEAHSGCPESEPGHEQGAEPSRA